MTRTLAKIAILAIALSSSTVLASADAATSHHATRTAKAGAFKVTASVNKTDPLLDTKVKIKGSVSPAAPGAAVTLQVRYEDRNEWKTIDTARLNNASKYKFKDKVGSVRERKYRVVKPAGATRSAGRSPAVKVTVFGWRDAHLAEPGDRPPTCTRSTRSRSTAITYPDSIRSLHRAAARDTDPIDYNLNRDCKPFAARYGISRHLAGPAPASLASCPLTTCRVQRQLRADPVGRSSSFDVTKVFRITVTPPPATAYAAVGTPQVLCSF